MSFVEFRADPQHGKDVTIITKPCFENSLARIITNSPSAHSVTLGHLGTKQWDFELICVNIALRNCLKFQYDSRMSFLIACGLLEEEH
jgi:hypothetical protein